MMRGAITCTLALVLLCLTEHAHAARSLPNLDILVEKSTSRTAAPSISDERFQAFVEDAAECADDADPLMSTDGNDNVYHLGTSKVEARWGSTRQISVNDVTLVTQLDRSRISMLRGQCKAWSGPLVAVVYAPLKYFATEENKATLKGMKAELAALHKVAEASKKWCTLDIILLSELRTSEDVWAYPYNANRNHAIARSRTRLVLLLDVDFLPSGGLRESLLEPAAWEAAIETTERKKTVMILPAFETKQELSISEGLKVAKQAAATSKTFLKVMYDAGDVTQFAPFYARGHKSTNYTRFFDSEKAYGVRVSSGYEPYIILSRVQVPWFDERFRGYGWDKITHIYQMNHTGFTFEVLANAWVVHRPHQPSPAYSKAFTGPAYSKKHKPTAELKKLDKLAEQMMAAVKAGTYSEHGVTTLSKCRDLSLLYSDAAVPLRSKRLDPSVASLSVN